MMGDEIILKFLVTMNRREKTCQKKLISGLEDIIALEAKPWEDVTPAQSIYDLLVSAADKCQDNVAICYLPTGSPDEESLSITFKQMIGHINQAANMFHDLGCRAQGRGSFSITIVSNYVARFWSSLVLEK